MIKINEKDFTAADYYINFAFLDFISADRNTFENPNYTEMFLLIANQISKFNSVIEWGIEKSMITIVDVFSFAEICESHNIDIYKKVSVLKRELESLDSIGFDINPSEFYCYGNYEDKIQLERRLSLLSLKSEYNYSELGKKVFDFNRSYYLRENALKKLAKLWATNNPSSYKQYFFSRKFDYEIRAILAYGFAFSKMTPDEARKFRSECMSVSIGTAVGLIESKDIYSKLEFAQVIAQFSDSKYENVINYLAEKLPLENLNILLANPLCPEYIISRRMNK